MDMAPANSGRNASAKKTRHQVRNVASNVRLEIHYVRSALSETMNRNHSQAGHCRGVGQFGAAGLRRRQCCGIDDIAGVLGKCERLKNLASI